MGPSDSRRVLQNSILTFMNIVDVHEVHVSEQGCTFSGMFNKVTHVVEPHMSAP